jgi:hypothetical protein
VRQTENAQTPQQALTDKPPGGPRALRGRPHIEAGPYSTAYRCVTAPSSDSKQQRQADTAGPHRLEWLLCPDSSVGRARPW